MYSKAEIAGRFVDKGRDEECCIMFKTLYFTSSKYIIVLLAQLLTPYPEFDYKYNYYVLSSTS